MTPSEKAVLAVRWFGRVACVLLFLLWGAFFVEHLREWFLHIGPPWPPPKVWVAQTFHLLLLLGYVSALKWEMPGSLLIIASATIFFGLIGSAALGYLLVSLAPVPAFLWCQWRSKQAASARAAS